MDATLQAVLLVVAKVLKVAGGGWGSPSLHAMLLSSSSTDWVSAAGGSARAGRGQCAIGKPALIKLWGKMQWVRRAGKEGGTSSLLFAGFAFAFEEQWPKGWDLQQAFAAEPMLW